MDRGVAVDTRGEVTKTGDIDQAVLGRGRARGVAREERAGARLRGHAVAALRAGARGRKGRHLLARGRTRGVPASGGDLKELVVALTQTDAFLNYKRP